MPGAAEVVADPAIDRLIVTDTVPPFRKMRPETKIDTVHTAPLFATAIHRLCEGQAVTDLPAF
jgi:ribose-phosphate pyrophosphokinase